MVAVYRFLSSAHKKYVKTRGRCVTQFENMNIDSKSFKLKAGVILGYSLLLFIYFGTKTPEVGIKIGQRCAATPTIVCMDSDLCSETFPGERKTP